MSVQGEILPQTAEQLFRPDVGQVRFSDVFPEVAELHSTEPYQEMWWRRTDYDSQLTDQVESSGFPKAFQVPIGLRPWLANYGLILVDDLVRSQADRVIRSRLQDQKGLHPDLVREIQAQEDAVIALANYAPRDEANTANGANGSDFYLAVTDAGLEIYATPLKFLGGLDARHRINALYRIPTKGHPEFNGDHEQFRSARVTRTRRHPTHLVPIFQYEDTKALLAAKESGEHPLIIPADPRAGHIAFVDKFGNIRGDLADLSPFKALEVGRFATLLVVNNGHEYEFGVTVAANLPAAPLGKLAIYANCSDIVDHQSLTGYLEIVARVDDDPNTSTDTAVFQVLNKIPDLDPATAELKLVA